MRLSNFYQETIKSTGLEIFGNDTKIYLFGSRADDTKRGGDIDLYIDAINNNDLFEKIQFLTKLHKRLGDKLMLLFQRIKIDQLNRLL